jgi:hypothetical protein
MNRDLEPGEEVVYIRAIKKGPQIRIPTLTGKTGRGDLYFFKTDALEVVTENGKTTSIELNPEVLGLTIVRNKRSAVMSEEPLPLNQPHP